MVYELWIGMRYAGLARSRRGRGHDRFVSFIAASSMTGIALGVAALIVVLSVMNGFQRDVRDRMLSVIPHIELYAVGQTPDQTLDTWQDMANSALNNSSVEAAAPFVSAQAMVARGQELAGIEVRGIDPANETGVSDLAEQMLEGSLDELQPGKYKIVLGGALASRLQVGLGDTLLVLAPQGNITPAGFTPRMRQFTVSGVFSSGHYEYDSSLAFMDVTDAARVFRDGSTSGVRLRIHDMHKAIQVSGQLRRDLPGNVHVRDWSQNNRTWFAAVQTEKRMMFLILTLIIAVAAFNLLSSLVMAVKDRRADIAILRTLGATPAEVARVFLVQGALIGVVGTAAGVGLGALVAWNIDVVVPFIENLLDMEFLPAQIYFITEMPSDPHWSDITIIGVTSLILSLLATLYPSWRASRLQPAKVLRYD